MPPIRLDATQGMPKLRLVVGHNHKVNYEITYIAPGDFQSEPLSVSQADFEEGYSLENNFDSVAQINGYKIRWLITITSRTGAEGEQYSLKLDLIQGDDVHTIIDESGPMPVDPFTGEVEIIV